MAEPPNSSDGPEAPAPQEASATGDAGENVDSRSDTKTDRALPTASEPATDDLPGPTRRLQMIRERIAHGDYDSDELLEEAFAIMLNRLAEENE